MRARLVGGLAPQSKFHPFILRPFITILFISRPLFTTSFWPDHISTEPDKARPAPEYSVHRAKFPDITDICPHEKSTRTNVRTKKRRGQMSEGLNATDKCPKWPENGDRCPDKPDTTDKCPREKTPRTNVRTKKQRGQMSERPDNTDICPQSRSIRSTVCTHHQKYVHATIPGSNTCTRPRSREMPARARYRPETFDQDSVTAALPCRSAATAWPCWAAIESRIAVRSHEIGR